LNEECVDIDSNEECVDIESNEECVDIDSNEECVDIDSNEECVDIDLNEECVDNDTNAECFNANDDPNTEVQPDISTNTCWLTLNMCHANIAIPTLQKQQISNPLTIYSIANIQPMAKHSIN
jgi:hypothetical protein